MKLSCQGLTGAAAILAAVLGLNLIGPHRAYAAPRNIAVPGDSDLGVTILNPDPHTPLTGPKPVEISAFYQGSPTNQIVAVELYLDGHKAAAKTLDVPETRGVVSFLVDASQLSPGPHRIVVRATAADEEVKSVKSSFQFGTADNATPFSVPSVSLPTGPALGSDLVPTLHLADPSEDGKVQGVVTLRVQATDPSGKAPYVSFFIDKAFKGLRNFAPYEFDWDTTTYSNGYHTIQAYGYNEAGNASPAKTLRLYVNNPGGETSIRHDLFDGVKTVKPVVPHVPAHKAAVHKSLMAKSPVTAHVEAALPPQKSFARPLPLRRPDLPTADEQKAANAPPARIASVMPAHIQSTREIIRHLVRGANSLHFGALGPATELSTPYVSEQPAALEPATPQITRPKRAIMPTEGYRPLPAIGAVPDTDPNMALLAETAATNARRVSGKIAHLQRMASVRLPSSDLASPFLAAPHVAPLPTKMTVQIAVPLTEMGLTSKVIKPVLKMHPLRIHLPAGLGSLLRSVGQTSVEFNHTTVQMDRPLVEQNNILFGPLRQIFEQDGGSLTWQPRTGTVHAKNATKDITLTIGKVQALVNAQEITLDGKPYLMMGRTMVPLSFVTAAMDADVQYDAATGHLLITSRK